MKTEIFDCTGLIRETKADLKDVVSLIEPFIKKGVKVNLDEIKKRILKESKA